MNMPHPGQLRQRIVIGKTVNTINTNGYPTETDTTVCTVWAGVEDGASKWFYSADANQSKKGLSFIIRWRPEVLVGMWVSFSGKKHLITEIGEFDYRQRYMRLVTQNVEGIAP